MLKFTAFSLIYLLKSVLLKALNLTRNRSKLFKEFHAIYTERRVATLLQ